MSTQIVMPKWGLSMQEGLIGQWMKAEGDAVRKGDPLLEVETEKITNVVESPTDGILARILYPAGSTVPVTVAIAYITAPGESLADLPSDSGASAQQSGASDTSDASDAPDRVPAPPPAPTLSAVGNNIPALPAARKLAKEHGIDLATIKPTGSTGAITKEDVERAIAARVAAETTPRPAGSIIPAMPAARKLAKEHGIDLATVQATGVNGVITKEDVERAMAAPKAIPPVAISTLQKVAFYSDGHRLDGLLYSPKGAMSGHRLPAVALLVGYTYTKTMVMPDIAKVLAAAGYVALCFDYRGFGDSEGPRSRLIPDEQVRDARAALTFLSDQPHVDADRLAVIGISLGGSHAITVGALDPRVKAAVALEPMGDGERWLRSLRRYWEWDAFRKQLTQDRLQRVRSGHSTFVDSQAIVVPDPESQGFLEQVARNLPQSKVDVPLETGEALLEYSPESVAYRLADRASLIIHGDGDLLVPVHEAESLASAIGDSCRLEVLPGMTHFNWVMPNSPGFRQVTELVLGFLEKAL